MQDKVKGTAYFMMSDLIGSEHTILKMYKVRRKRVQRWVRCYSTDRVLRLTTPIKKLWQNKK
jgi:hypothetical protein